MRKILLFLLFLFFLSSFAGSEVSVQTSQDLQGRTVTTVLSSDAAEASTVDINGVVAQIAPKFEGYIVELKAPAVLEVVAEDSKILAKLEKDKGKIEKNIADGIVSIALERSVAVFEKKHDNVKKQIREKTLNQKDVISSEKARFLSKLESLPDKTPTGAAVADIGETVVTSFDTVINAVVVDVSADEIKEIEKLPEVKRVTPNYEVKTMLMDSVPLIGANQVWQLDADGNNCATSGKDCLTGKGVKIAIIDTGVDYTHIDLGGNTLDTGELRGTKVSTGGDRSLARGIDQNWIAYVKYFGRNSDVYAFNIDNGATHQITNDIYYQEFLTIDGDTLVWDDQRLGNSDIFSYDMSTSQETQLTNDAASQTVPTISGNRIVWMDNRNANWELYMYDLATRQTTRVTNDPAMYNGNPKLSGDTLVWLCRFNDGPPSVAFYPSVCIKNLVTNEFTKIAHLPDEYIEYISISGGKVAWISAAWDSTTGFDSAGSIYVYNIETREQARIGDSTAVKSQIKISGNNIIWRDTRNGNPNIYKYNLVTGQEQPITCDIFDQQAIDIDGDFIIWSDGRGADGIQVYYYSLSNAPLTCNLPAAPSTFPNSKVIGGYDFVNNDADPMDDQGHGTHVAATAAGNGVLKGVAPDAKIYAYKVLSSSGSGSESNIIKAIERSFDVDGDGILNEGPEDKLDIISLSIGGPGNPDDPMSTAIDNAVNNGVVAVVAAGNSGPSEGTINSPGTARKAITVGATYKKNYDDRVLGKDVNPRQGQITFFSSRGPTSIGTIKPDILAPGAIICAAQWGTAFEGTGSPLIEPCLVDQHIAISGTSMATPHVAGVVALMKQKYPSWTPDEIKAALKVTAIDIGLNPNQQGKGRIDVPRALALVSQVPMAELIMPSEIKEIIDIRGTLRSTKFASYSLQYASVGSSTWTTITTQTSLPVSNVLFSGFDTRLLGEGSYFFKLVITANDGLSNEDSAYVKVNNLDIKNPESGDVHRAGDLTEIRGANHILGMITAEYGRGWSPTTWQTGGITAGTERGDDVILATFDTSILTEADFYTIKITSGITEEKRIVYFDPTLRRGWPQKINGCGSDTTSCLSFGADPLANPVLFDVNTDGFLDVIVKRRNPVNIFHANGNTIPGQFNIGDDSVHGGIIASTISGTPFLVSGSFSLQGKKLVDNTLVDFGSLSYIWCASFSDILSGDSTKEIILSAGGGSDGKLYAFYPSGDGLLWSPVLIGGNALVCPVRVGSNLILESVTTGALTCTFGPGILRCSPIRSGGKLVALDPLGNLLWEKITSSGAFSLVSGNVVGDERQELIVITRSQVSVLNLQGEVLSGWPQNIAGNSLGLALADINGDNVLDIVTLGNIFTGDGSLIKTFAVPDKDYQYLVVADVNNDGKEDIVTQYQELDFTLGKFYSFIAAYDLSGSGSNADLIFSKRLRYGSWLNGPAIGDLDNDGNLELIGSDGQQAYVWNLNVPSTKKSWPMIFFDAENSKNPFPTTSSFISQSQLPDLSVEKFLYGNPFADTVTHMQVRNIGTATPDFDVKAEAFVTLPDGTNQNILSMFVPKRLLVGGSGPASPQILYGLSQPGVYTFEGIIDPNNEVIELNENNNRYTWRMKFPCEQNELVCNEIDDNCDQIFEPTSVDVTCGVGQCQRIMSSCADGLTQSCMPGIPTTEVCNGLDDDCDAQTDEDIGSTTCGIGLCQVTVPNCVGGLTQSCTPRTPTAEVCNNNLDDDCDGVADIVDSDCTCTIGQFSVARDSCRVRGDAMFCPENVPVHFGVDDGQGSCTLINCKDGSCSSAITR